MVGSTTASSVVNFAISAAGEAYPLRFSHVAPTVQTCGTPFTHRFAALNSPLGYGGAYGAQPPTMTITDVTNIVNTFTSASYGTVLTNTYGARQYSFACLKTLDLSGNAEQLLGIRMTGDSFLSVISGTAVTNVTTNSRPIPNWDTNLVVAGFTISSSGVVLGRRELQRRGQAHQPGVLDGSGNPGPVRHRPRPPQRRRHPGFRPDEFSEMPLDLMLLNSQPPVSISVSNSNITNAGTPFTLTITMSQCAQVKSKVMRNKPLLGYRNSYEGVANSTDMGGI